MNSDHKLLEVSLSTMFIFRRTPIYFSILAIVFISLALIYKWSRTGEGGISPRAKALLAEQKMQAKEPRALKPLPNRRQSTESRLAEISRAPEMTIWKSKRGYDIEQEHSEYLAYSTSQLKLLAGQGDPVAMQVVGERLMLDAPGIGERYLKSAAVHGYTVSLISLANLKLVQFQQASDENRDALRYDAYIYELVMRRRGDVLGPYFLNVLGIARPSDATIDAKCRERAERVYQDLLAERRSLGLGDFDNTPPPDTFQALLREVYLSGGH